MVRDAKLFLPHYKDEEMNTSLKPKSLVRHVSLDNDPIFGSAESMMSFMRDHVDK